MMMQALHAGGLAVLIDDDGRSGDACNPRGYWEYGPVKKLRQESGWLDQAGGCALKVLARYLPGLPDRYRYCVLFMMRDLVETARSTRALLRLRGLGSRRPFDEDKAVQMLRNERGRAALGKDWVTMFVQYGDVVVEPDQYCELIKQRLGTGFEGLDAAKMAGAIDGGLRHFGENL